MLNRITDKIHNSTYILSRQRSPYIITQFVKEYSNVRNKRMIMPGIYSIPDPMIFQNSIKKSESKLEIFLSPPGY